MITEQQLSEAIKAAQNYMEQFDDEVTDEVLTSDKVLGEKFASDFIASARKRYKSPRYQAKELRRWFEFAKVFPASSIHSLPILAAEINRLEGSDECR